MTNSVTVSANGAGMVGAALAVTGTVSPAGDTVQVQLSTSVTTMPTGAWTIAATANGMFAANLTPVAAGTWYVWAYDPISGAQAVSGAVLVASPALQTVAALPIPTAIVASLLGGSAAGRRLTNCRPRHPRRPATPLWWRKAAKPFWRSLSAPLRNGSPCNCLDFWCHRFLSQLRSRWKVRFIISAFWWCRRRASRYLRY